MARQQGVTVIDAPSFGDMWLYEYYDWLVLHHQQAMESDRVQKEGAVR